MEKPDAKKEAKTKSTSVREKNSTVIYTSIRVPPSSSHTQIYTIIAVSTSPLISFNCSRKIYKPTISTNRESSSSPPETNFIITN